MNRSGTYIRNLTGNLAYSSFQPSDLPPKPNIAIDESLGKQLNEAYRLLGLLDGISRHVPNKSLFLSMYVRKEALLSSQIEGTQATLEDVFDPFIDQNANLDVEEVIQYLKAINEANALVATLPISIRFIKEIHRVLLSSTRGNEKDPGELRRTQNWIGAPGCSLRTARFVPPNVSDMMHSLSNLESFIHQNDSMDPLVKIALVHYQFETIHPFLDGNGRIGRLLISVLLKQYGLLHEDAIYLSYYFKKNRAEYYDRLMDVRIKGQYESWIAFFVNGIIESANHARTTMEALMDLRLRHLSQLETLTGKPKQTAIQLFEYIETHPIIEIKKTSIALGRSFNTVSTMVTHFIEFGFLKQIDGNKRYRIFAYEPYLAILRDGISNTVNV